MRKQIDFVVRVFPLGNGSNGTITGEQLSEIIRSQYLRNGYEVFKVDAIQVSGFQISYHVALIKYQVDEEVRVVAGGPETQTINVKSGK